jgi:hypothetical protein
MQGNTGSTCTEVRVHVHRLAGEDVWEWWATQPFEVDLSTEEAVSTTSQQQKQQQPRNQHPIQLLHERQGAALGASTGGGTVASPGAESAAVPEASPSVKGVRYRLKPPTASTAPLQPWPAHAKAVVIHGDRVVEALVRLPVAETR